MFELGAGQAGPPAGDLIRDGSDATFMQDVVEASHEVPVIVDFWATWCGPCKTLGPALEEAVKAARGKVRLIKVDIDRNQAVAAQLRIQSIPTVHAFYQGRPVDGFQGALPPSEVRAFVNRISALAAGGGGPEQAIEAAENMLAGGAAADAARTFAAVLVEEPENADAYGGLVRAHLATGDLDQAEAILNGAPAGISDAPGIEAARAQLELARQAADAGPVADLRAEVAANPDNHQARFDLATALHAGGDTEGAVAELLELFRRDRAWNDGAAKAQLLTVFGALKPNDPLALSGRRRLSSMIFA